MRLGRTMPPSLNLTRRALARRLVGAGAVIGIGYEVAAWSVAMPAPAMDAELRHAALQGIALAGQRGDLVIAAVANAALDRLAEADPEAVLLGLIYQMLDVRPAQYCPEDAPKAAATDLARLHSAIRACQTECHVAVVTKTRKRIVMIPPRSYCVVRLPCVALMIDPSIKHLVLGTGAEVILGDVDRLWRF